MKTEEGLYIRILIWAYNRQESGFTWDDLKREFELNSDQEQWVQKIFRSNMPTGDNLIDHLDYARGHDIHTLVITSKGISAAVQYLNLKEAEGNGKRAEKIAIASIIIGILVGIASIIVNICFR
jgi:hypothetical protein